MRTKMQDTSLDAFHSKDFLSQENLVLQFIRQATFNGYDVTDEEISRALQIKVSSVNGRRNKLMTNGLVKKSRRVWNDDSKAWNWAWKSV